ncbi:argonaute-like protein [Crepidotus variabilis]|uniref:Argonaute-like protein n=1 Tax=Crepidotus variabilis TaxID=179855 RepID=A0A9P6JKH3_9AGAR|nr:argonaute-like protein [Crepidotus variabilis]
MSYRGDRGRGRGGPPGDRGRGGGGGFRGGDRGRGGFGGAGRGRGEGGIFQPGQPANIDARIADNSDQQLVASLQTLKLNPNELPIRRGFGTVGTAIKLRANFFPVQFDKTRSYFEYNVTIHPAVAIRRVKRRIFQLAEESTDWANFGLRGAVAHDSSSKLIAARELAQPITVKIQFFDEDEQGPRKDGKEYTLTIEYIQTLSSSDLYEHLFGQPQYRDFDVMPTVTAFNLILGAFANRSGGGGIMVGRNRFFFPGSMESFNLGGGLEAFKGFYSSVRPAHKQLMVNVNVCTTAFYKQQNLAEAMIEFKNASFGARPIAFVKGVRVVTLHLKHRKTVKTLSSMNARQFRFKVAEYNDEEYTVEQYFKKKYNLTLRYPDVPLVDVGGQKQNLMPAELCQILPDQPFRGKLTDEHTAEMIKYAAKPPNINAIAITTKGLEKLGFGANRSPQMAAFGVSVGSEMAVVPARILPPPRIQYGKGTPSVDDKASWNLRDVKFSRGGRLENWAVLVIRDGNDSSEFSNPRDAEFINTYRGFAEMCRKSGMSVDTADPQIAAVRLTPKQQDELTRTKAIGDIETALKSLKKKPSIILVLLSNGDKHVYSGLKYLCDTILDVATVCVHTAKIRKEKGQLQYFANVALKFNTKLGGVNHALDTQSMSWLKKLPTMLVGIDVTHPGPGSVKGTPSIAAVVASCESEFAQYPASMEMQESRKEMVTNLDRMMIARLDLFKTRNKGVLPQRVLVYRDGVSEGQFNTVVNEELPLLKLAFRKYDAPNKPYTPALTIVICGKRHHTRFYPTEENQSDGQGNPRPGTVVDRGVTAIYNNDFFLQAHGGLQGTTRPTHYYVVHDEIGFKPDELQVLTNSVSYMFARATKAVSLVSPAYYADLACERGRCYLHKLLHGLGPQNPTDENVLAAAVAAWRQGVNGRSLKDTMYYL